MRRRYHGEVGEQEDFVLNLPLPPKIKDYKLKPLKKFQRPYFSPRVGSYEIDYTEARTDNWTMWYFVCININTKYLIMYALEMKERKVVKKQSIETDTDIEQIDTELGTLPILNKPGQTVENTLEFIKMACEEISQKFGQKMTNVRADGGREFAKRVEAPTVVGESGYLPGGRKAKRPTTWFKSQEIITNPLTEFFVKNKIDFCLYTSPYTNKNRVVDRAIRTIRDIMGSDPDSFIVREKVASAVNYYNNKPHAAFDYQFTPTEVQSSPGLEEHFIRKNKYKLEEIRQLQDEAGFYSYYPGNILLIHLDESKKNPFADKRRIFNKLASFIRYQNGNVVCFLLLKDEEMRLGRFRREIEIPIYNTKFLAFSQNQIPKKYLALISIQPRNFIIPKK